MAQDPLRPTVSHPEATGLFVAVVGPSGAGKDTVMRESLKDWPPASRITVARRVITRGDDSEGEAHRPVDEATFAAMKAEGEFLLHWQAHGLHYAIPMAVLDTLRAGGAVIANLSRTQITIARALLPNVLAIEIGADETVLRSRLTSRGREGASDAAQRIARNTQFPEGAEDINAWIDNSGPLEVAIKAFRDYLADRLLAHEVRQPRLRA